MTANLVALFSMLWVKFAGATTLTSTCCPPGPFCGQRPRGDVSINAAIRKVTSKKGAFPTEEAVRP